MKTGDIILVPFPFSDLLRKKVRPAVVIASTKDKYEDIIVSAVRSVIPSKLSANEFVLMPTKINKLRAKSVVKVDRIVTMKRDHIITALGRLSLSELQEFKTIFRNLV